MNKKSKLVCLGLCYALNGTVCYGTQINNYIMLSDNNCGFLNNNVKMNSNKIFVQDANTLAIAISNSRAGEKIILNNDINLDRNIEIKNSVNIDLNGNKLKLTNGSKIIVGEKVFDHTEYKTVHHSGQHVPHCTTKYVTQSNGESKEVKETSWVWEPGWNETISENIYRYMDNIDVVFENGEIKGSEGASGRDGQPNTFFACSGKNGENGDVAMDIISGAVRLRNIRVIGGDGGHGGDGAYQAILHIPFFTGNAGHGGNGGNSGAAVLLQRKECKLIQDINTGISRGNPGYGGKGGEANPNHWIGHGTDGKDGKIGKTSVSIYKNYEH